MNTQDAEKLVMEKNNDELLAILAHPTDWQSDILDAARAQLQRRGVEFSTAIPKVHQEVSPEFGKPQVVSNPPSRLRNLTRIGLATLLTVIIVLVVIILLSVDKAKDFRSDINRISMGMSGRDLASAIGEPQDRSYNDSYQGHIFSFEYLNQGAKKLPDANRMLEVYFSNGAVCGWAVLKVNPAGGPMRDSAGRTWSVVLGKGYQVTDDGSKVSMNFN